MLHYCLDLTGKIVHTWYIKCYWKRKTTRKLIFISFIFSTLAKVTGPTTVDLCKTKENKPEELLLCYFSLINIKIGNISAKAPEKLSPMTDVCVCPCMCVAASNLLISKSSLESSYHCLTHTDHQHLICHRGGRFGCLAEKPKDNAKKPC